MAGSTFGDLGDTRQEGPRRARPLMSALLSLGVFFFAVGAAVADQQPDSGEPLIPANAVEQIAAGAEVVMDPSTDSEAAALLPHKNLNREEAMELLQGVFEAQLQAPAGAFDELEVQRFLSDHVALLAPGNQPEAAEGEAEGNRYEGATLLSSTVPLRTESSSGEEKVVELGLEHSGGELQPANPLVEVQIPQELGEGIVLPESGVEINLVGAPQERSPTTIAESVAFYPNVSLDTDLAIAPTPTGIETLTHIRSAEAPQSQTFELNLPEGAVLKATEEGGAEVIMGEDALLGVAPPAALDATGSSVPVTLEVSGSSLILTVFPDGSTQFPILLDPLIQSYKWEEGKPQIGITGNTGYEQWSPETYAKGGISKIPYKQEMGYGLFVASTLQPAFTGDHSTWIYTVPRYFTDGVSTPPTSFISYMSLSGLTWWANSAFLSPYLKAGLWDVTNKNWVSLASHDGLKGHSITDTNWVYKFTNPNANGNVKLASLGLWAQENTSGYTAASVRATTATIELAEPATANIPGFVSISEPSKWVNQTSAPIDFVVSDTGLGVYSLTVTPEQKATPSWKTAHGCTGVGGSPCPRTWNSKSAGPPLKYEPSLLPQGINTLKVVAEDPLAHVSLPANVQVKVDHTAPALAISGPLSEVAAVGEEWPTYKLNFNATDGASNAPQSGVVKTVVKIDGKVVNEVSQGCETQNCSINKSWTLEASKYAQGNHTLDVVATDAIGLSTTKTRTFKLKNASAPQLSLSGSITEQAAIGVSRPRYKLEVSASTAAPRKVPQPAPVPSFYFGSEQFAYPEDVVVDGQGNVWVASASDNTIKQFDAKGKYLKAIGKYVSNGCGLNGPRDLAIDSTGKIWVANQNGRVVKLNTTGECLLSFGGAGSIGNAAGIAIDASGNLWISDWGKKRVYKYSAAGQYLSEFGSQGTGPGQFSAPGDIAIGIGGMIWVTDTSGRIEKFNAQGQYVSQIAEKGWGNGELFDPRGLATDANGNLWVAERTKNHIEKFNSEGEYLSQFGSYGTGWGGLSSPGGIALDGTGNIWVADTENDRMEKWRIPQAEPSLSLTVGSAGSGDGQLSNPGGIATDAEGNHWVADTENDRIEKFGPEGEYLGEIGESGSGNGQLSGPRGVALDMVGNLWVADSGNGRLQRFSPQGAYLGKSESNKLINLEYPTSVAVDSEGSVWATDLINGRIVQYGPLGEFLWNWFGTQGTGEGQLQLPYGITADGEGNLWVADSYNNRIQGFTSWGEYLGEFGNEGSGAGELYFPLGITTDADGNFWVADSGSSRVVQFGPEGAYLNHFGWGKEMGELQEPLGVAVDPDGKIWVTDGAKNHLQAWDQASSSGIESKVTTEISIDGKQVYSNTASCEEATCSLQPEWTLDSAEFSAGEHTVLAKATDVFGRTTSDTVDIEVQPDTVKPVVQLGGELADAPEGWVEQEGYGLNASASDEGYGVTSLALKIDGEVVASASQACPDGGCEETLAKSIDMSEYPGGAHPAQLIAIDGAGNTSTKSWTINVDPEGHISVAEAEDTLEAVEETSPVNAIDKSQEEELSGTVPGLGIEEAEGEILTTGTQVPTVIAGTPGGGVSLDVLDEDPEGEEEPGLETITIAPVQTAENATETEIVAKNATVTANTSNHVDTIIRPLYDGVMAFRNIRDSAGPESFSWKVPLNAEQELKSIDDKFAGVFYKNGYIAIAITVTPAHDAIGTNVPTKLSVEGDVITLTVEHRSATFVYPIIAGAGWEGGFQTTDVEMPPPPPPPENPSPLEAWRLSFESETHDILVVGAPEPVPGNEADASTSALGEMRKKFARTICGHDAREADGMVKAVLIARMPCGNAFTGDQGKFVLWHATQRGAFLFAPGKRVRHKNATACNKGMPGLSIYYEWKLDPAYECQYGPKTSDGNGGASANAGHYLRAQAHWLLWYRGNCGDLCSPNPWYSKDKAQELHLWPSGAIDVTVTTIP